MPTDELGLRMRVVETAHISERDIALVKTVFAENYRDANIGYLEKSLGKLAFLALAEDTEGTVAGFALGETRILDLPRLPAATVRLAGLCCVGAEYRRHGLFRKLESLAISARELPAAERSLSCGRMAHPGSFRGMAQSPSVVPRRGQRPSEWQQQVGSAVAEAYGTPGFDPETFVCKGTGVPIGWPVIDLETTDEEWEVFRPVDRAKGDSLLGLAWNPTPPEGWLVQGAAI